MGEETRAVQFQIPAKELADLEQWARNSERPLDELLGEAVHAYVERQRAFAAAVQEGLDDIRAGRTISSEELHDHMAEVKRRFFAQRG